MNSTDGQDPKVPPRTTDGTHSPESLSAETHSDFSESLEEGERPSVGAELIGTVVADRYRVQKLLGRGGMGAVFQAEHVQLKKQVALKILHVHMSDNPEVVARFEREAVAAGRLQHPGVVGATDFGSLADGSFYLALELVDGRNLSETLAEVGHFHPERALGVAYQVNSALCAAHAEGIIHRDLKPDNVMLLATREQEDFVKVLDFGIAKIRLDGDHQEGLTRAGLVFGTPEYMSPEQAMGHEADARSDLYSIGVLLFEMLSGSSPFHHEDLTAMLTAQITERPPELPAELPAPLSRLVYQLLEKDPESRPSSAEELAEILVHLAERLGYSLPAPRTSAGTRLDKNRRSSADKKEVQIRSSSQGALSSIRSLSMQPIAIGNTKLPSWLPVLALVVGGSFGAFFMLTNEEVVVPEEVVAKQELFDAEAQLLTDARSGDRDAISELRKLAALKQKELSELGLLDEAGATDNEAGEEGPAAASAKVAEAAPPAPAESPGSVDSQGQLGPDAPPVSELVSIQSSRYMALGRGYSVIKHSSAATEMYREAVLLDPHLAQDPDLLIDVRVALGARDAVDAGLDFALEHLGAHGADLIYDVYLDHLGQAGMTPVVARAMRLVKGGQLPKEATSELQVALALQKAKYCAEYRLLLPDAEKFADDRSLQKLRALKARRGCGTFGNKDCFVCIRTDEAILDRAIAHAETHASPTFLTPAEQLPSP